MRNLRLALSLISLVLLLLGYLASQVAALSGEAADYSARVDVAPVRWLALAVLGVAVALSLIPDREDSP